MSLSKQIFRDTPNSFFSVLTWRYGKQYIDVLDGIESLQRHRHGVGLSRPELLQLCQDVIDQASFPEGDPTDDSEEAQTITAPEMLRQMLQCQWLEEPRRSDYQRVYYLDSRAELLLECLRRMAHPEQVNFTDKLHLVCTRIMDEQAFEDHPLADIEVCNDNLRYGLQELRSMQQSMARLTQRQLHSDTLKENLQVLYDEFSEHISQRAYKSLIDLDLPVRMPLIQNQLESIRRNPQVVAKMELEMQKRRPDLNESEVADYVLQQLEDTQHMLNSVEPQAEAVDRRAAEFARRSFARFRYLQEVSSGRRSEVRELFETINDQYAGCKLNSLPLALQLPDLKIPHVDLLGGMDSLFTPRIQREKGTPNPLSEYFDEADIDFALDEISENINASLSVMRANSYASTLDIPEQGLASAELPTDHEQWALNTVALLLHSEALDSSYEIKTPRDSSDYTEMPDAELVDDRYIDPFTLHHK
ncbi:Wadjet anti-phage system protein JetA family protein [Rubritalea marina]|uniref:Wadjet anti-phage system protein JetA family protein n=1 Tax=Rubritalea marina TaxID=361055 RepID=UPI000368D314|nr:Wadjet anti-phage system protein JetA family protein [Rubritalea marina]